MLLNACTEEKGTISNEPMNVRVSHQLEMVWQDVAVHYMTSGTVTSDHRVSISARLPGYIRDMKVREGDHVEVGQVLLRIDPVNAKQALIQTKADLSNAKAEMIRYASLLKAGAITPQQADKVKLRYQVARSQVKQAKHQLSYANVVSPVKGVIVEKRMAQGDLAAMGMPILSIEDPSNLLVKTYVSEQFVGRIHESDTVDVKIPSLKQQFQGTVRQVVQAADPVSHQFLVKIALPTVVDIHPGMYAEAGFDTGMRKALLLPNEAIISRAGLHAVYVMDEMSMTHYRQIRLGQKRSNMIEVLAGLYVGDRVVWGGKPALLSGMKVQP
ncbi:MAG: efflux RND transporter periplasmic adaptor subunit [Mariprofundaceae bacterium]|nr:efflux RND transporter periplasmic adaptor subunit [Mariprofundaceae bacterium]